jgi:hypothetical protein
LPGVPQAPSSSNKVYESLKQLFPDSIGAPLEEQIKELAEWKSHLALLDDCLLASTESKAAFISFVYEAAAKPTVEKLQSLGVIAALNAMTMAKPFKTHLSDKRTQIILPCRFDETTAHCYVVPSTKSEVNCFSYL